MKPPWRKKEDYDPTVRTKEVMETLQRDGLVSVEAGHAKLTESGIALVRSLTSAWPEEYANTKILALCALVAGDSVVAFIVEAGHRLGQSYERITPTAVAIVANAVANARNEDDLLRLLSLAWANLETKKTRESRRLAQLLEAVQNELARKQGEAYWAP
jgi:hypothetical protein